MIQPDYSDFDYNNMTERDWVDYEFATIEYDYRIPYEAARRIERLFDRLWEAKLKQNA